MGPQDLQLQIVKKRRRTSNGLPGCQCIDSPGARPPAPGMGKALGDLVILKNQAVK